MASAQSPNPAELAAQLEHPNANSIWERAVEVFGDYTVTRLGGTAA